MTIGRVLVQGAACGCDVWSVTCGCEGACGIVTAGSGISSFSDSNLSVNFTVALFAMVL